MSKKLIDLLCWVLGPMLIVAGLLDVSSGDTIGGRTGGGHVFYFFKDGAILLTAIGVGLVAFGSLRRHWRKEQE